MIKKIFIFFFIISINDGLCGITVLGTRFIINDKVQRLNIKVSNDNENDYLIKSKSDDDNFITTPPLMLLKKDDSNLITIIPKQIGWSEDRIFNLTITAIPKLLDKYGANSVSIAVRSHFKIIYRHKELNDASFEKIMVVNRNNHCMLLNDSSFIFILSLSKRQNGKENKRYIVKPSERVMLGEMNSPSCDSWVNFHNEYDDIIRSIIPSRIK